MGVCLHYKTLQIRTNVLDEFHTQITFKNPNNINKKSTSAGINLLIQSPTLLPSLHHSKLCQNYKQFIKSLTKQFENQFEKTSQPQQKLNYQTIQFPIKPYKNTIPLSRNPTISIKFPSVSQISNFPGKISTLSLQNIPLIIFKIFRKVNTFPYFLPSLTSSHPRASYKKSIS